MKLKHLDLFSGIGGFALAVDTVWPGSEHIFCDNDLFCQQVLKKHWPNSKIYGDIRTLTNTGEQKSNGMAKQPRKKSVKNWECDILTGGFPCQPFSQAGKRKGTNDDRFLWPEMLRVIKEFNPTWIIAENVRGLLTINAGLVFEQVCLDLEAAGYEVQPVIIPAVAVNAPHRRDRVWFVAHRTSERIGGRAGKKCGIQGRTFFKGKQTGSAVRSESEGCIGDVADTKEQRGQCGKCGKCTQCKKELFGRNDTREWNKNWLEVATELCRVDDGLPAKLDGFELTKAGHRVQRLKSLGNAIVPQVAIEIMTAIKNSI